MHDSSPHNQESEDAVARLRRSFDDGLAGHAVAAGDGRIVACNPEFARITGFDTVEAALGANLHELEPRPGAFLSLVKRLSGSPLIPLEELQFTRRDGTPTQVLARLAGTVDDSGRVTEVRVYLVDITQRFREEQETRACAERLQLVEAATQDVLWDWDVATARIAWSSATAQRFRYAADEVRTALDWHAGRIHAEDRERVLRGVQRAMLGIDDTWSDEYRLLRGDGSWATVLDRAHIVRDSRGRPVRVVGSILDITELKATEESHRFLAQASAALESALDVQATAATLARISVPQFAEMCMVDLVQEDGTLRRAAAAHVRPSLEPALEPGAVLRAGSTAGAAQLDAISTGDVECIAGDPTPGDGTGRRLGVSEEADARAGIVVPITARGRMIGAVTFGFSARRHFFDPMFIATTKDLAGRAGLALDNSQLYEAARSAVESRNEVLGIVSHDLRVPLHTIVATLSLLSDSMPERRAEVRKLFDILHRATGQIDHLIEDLLDMSRLESKHFTIEPRQSSVVDMITEACDSLRHLAAEKHITLTSHIEDHIPSVAADAPAVVRVIGNLLGNAIRYSPEGATITVGARLTRRDLHISIRDEGPGIAPSDIGRVFDRFWQGRPNDRRGAGLGLAIARGIVEAHGGRIWVDSERGAGSTFTFSLPVGAANDGRTPASRDARESAGPGEHRSATVGPREHRSAAIPDPIPRDSRRLRRRPAAPADQSAPP